MTGGQQAVQAFLRHLGSHENPWGSNGDQGGWIDTIERENGMWHEPWCGMAYKRAYEEAGVDLGGVGSASTQLTCNLVSQRGWWLPRNHPVPAGAGLIKCGIHIEMAMEDAGPTDNGAHRIVKAIGGNVSDAVRLTTRSTADFAVFVPPAALQGTVELMKVYGFDDTTWAPKLYGPWAERDGRERVIHSRFSDDDHNRLVQRLYLPGRNHYAFRVYPVHGVQWRYGPWYDQHGRDEQFRAYQHAHPKHKLRTWSRTIQHQTVAPGALTTGERTT